jgi:hypothetical protein
MVMPDAGPPADPPGIAGLRRLAYFVPISIVILLHDAVLKRAKHLTQRQV